MIQLLVDAVLGVILLACGAVLVVATHDCLARGDRQVEQAIREMEKARDITGRI